MFYLLRIFLWWIRYGEKAEKVEQLGNWMCPKCRNFCNCSFCRWVSFIFVNVCFELVLYPWVHSNRGVIFVGKNKVNYLLVNYFIQPRHLVSSQCLKCLFQRLLNLMIWNWTRWIRFCFQRKLLRKRCATFLPILYPIYLVVDKYTYVCWLKNLLFTYANSWFVNGDRSKNV